MESGRRTVDGQRITLQVEITFFPVLNRRTTKKKTPPPESRIVGMTEVEVTESGSEMDG